MVDGREELPEIGEVQVREYYGRRGISFVEKVCLGAIMLASTVVGLVVLWSLIYLGYGVYDLLHAWWFTPEPPTNLRAR